MAINEYIRDLLLFNERVIFPGLGALEIKRETSKIGPAQMSPPVSVLTFNPELKRDDRLLSGKIAQGEEIESEEARERLLEFVDSILFAFNKGESFTIDGVGTLYQDQDNHIRVNRDPELRLELDSFGLETLELDPLDGQDEVSGVPEETPGSEEIPEQASAVTEGEGTGADESAEKAEAAEAAGTEHEVGRAEEYPAGAGIPPLQNEPGVYHFEEGGGKRNNNTIWILSGAVVVVLIALIIMTLKTDMLDGKSDLRSFFSLSDSTFEVNDDFSGLTDEDFEFDSMVSDMEHEIDSSMTAGNALNPQPAVEEPAAANHAVPSDLSSGVRPYHIIAGSFRDKDNAVKLQQELTMDGYPSLVLERGDGYYRVSAISFRDKQEALSKLKDFKKMKGMSGAWVMSID